MIKSCGNLLLTNPSKAVLWGHLIKQKKFEKKEKLFEGCAELIIFHNFFSVFHTRQAFESLITYFWWLSCIMPHGAGALQGFINIMLRRRVKKPAKIRILRLFITGSNRERGKKTDDERLLELVVSREWKQNAIRKKGKSTLGFFSLHNELSYKVSSSIEA